jgi:ankyrin repeat protein
MAEDTPEYFQPAAGQGGMNLLHQAAYSGDLAAAIQSIREGVDVNSQDEMRWSPLHWVVDMGMVAGERAEIVDALITAGADLNLQDWDGMTPLMIACRAGNGDLVRQLVEARANLEIRDKRGRTALLAAADYGLPATVSFLLERGADPTVRGVDGKSALDLAREQESDEIVALLSGDQS